MDDTTRKIPPPLPAEPAQEAPASRGLVAFGLSECGPVRKGNEDAFTFDMGLGLFVVADGMGGHAAGEVASRLAVEAIYAFVARSESDPELTWPFEPEAALSREANRLRNAVLLGNRRVFRAAECQSDYAGMGTTVVAALFGANAVAIAHVGDSRIYSYVDGRLTRLTEDDSLLASLKGSIDPAQHAKHPLRNVLTNVLGAREETEVHVADYPVAPGMRLLLCSDGLHGVVDDEQIAAVLAEAPTPRLASERLVAAALDAKGRDNVTSLVVDVPAAS
jgi:PPM family protein phosphatase